MTGEPGDAAAAVATSRDSAVLRPEQPAAPAIDGGADGSAPRCDWRAVLQLLRLPAVFTALADIFLGFALTHVGLWDAPLVLTLLLLSSATIYLAGMVFNDVVDREVDAQERPGRPLPSGRVSLRAAILLGSSLLATGLGSAAALRWVDPLLCGWNPLIVAMLLTAAVGLYDGLLKATPLGPAAMGLCRFLNILLGASAAGMLIGRPFDNPQRWVAAGMGVYIAGVTWFSRSEATASRRSELLGGIVLVNGGLAIWLAWLLNSILGARPELALTLLACIGLTLNRRMLATWAAPSPSAVQGTVRTLLLSIITLDAALIFAKTGDITTAALLAVALLLPALLLGRLIKLT